MEPGNGSDIQVRRWLSGTAAKPGNSSWKLDGDTLELHVECSGVVFECGRRFQVAVPPELPVVVRSGDGDSAVSGLSGPLTIEGGSGSVKVIEVSGDLKVRTREGDIAVSDIRSPTVHATSKNGAVNISFAAAPRLVDITSGTGHIAARVPVDDQRYRVAVTSGTQKAVAKVPNDDQSRNVVKLASREGNATLLPR